MQHSDSEIELHRTEGMLTGWWARGQLQRRLEAVINDATNVQDYLDHHQADPWVLDQVVDAVELLLEAVELLEHEGVGGEVRVRLNKAETLLSYIRPETSGSALYRYTTYLRRDLNSGWSFSFDIVDRLEVIG